jgi:hypothetical protein
METTQPGQFTVKFHDSRSTDGWFQIVWNELALVSIDTKLNNYSVQIKVVYLILFLIWKSISMTFFYGIDKLYWLFHNRFYTKKHALTTYDSFCLR